jgi:DNA-binding Lrp family transcriptional regulator
MGGFSFKTNGVYVDDLDLSILRWMYPGGVFSFWSTDPRITPAEIASHVGLDRTVIWDRLRKWRREGFWDGFEVGLNPATVGMREVRFEICVADPAEGWALLDELERIEGILWARVGFGDTLTQRDVEIVSLVLVVDHPTHLRRTVRSLRQLSPTGIIGGPFRNSTPPCSRELTPLDWRIIAAIVANPNAKPSQIARLVGVTPKTFVHHQSTLIEENAVCYRPKVDWSKMGCVCLGVFCHDGGDVEPVQKDVNARFPHLIPIAMKGVEGVNAGWEESTCFGLIVPAHSPHEVQTLLRDLSLMDGVRLVRPEYWGPERRFSRWVSQRIAEHLTTPAAAARGSIPRSGGRKSSGHATPTRRRISS